ncbi:MAG: hypothetical protein MUO34_10300 [Ignavibacteriaceae bacterium]|nr:hypothetical protein [Ignavibacteriaceae bacterium]
MIRFSYILGVIILLLSIYIGYEIQNIYIIVLSGLLIIANISAFIKSRQKNDLFNVVVNMSNCVMCFFIGFEILDGEKTYLIWIYFVSAFIFLIATYIIYRRNLRPFKKFSS